MSDLFRQHVIITLPAPFRQIVGIPRDCCKYKTKMVSRNALNPIWEETFEIEVHLPELAFARFTVSFFKKSFCALRITPTYHPSSENIVLFYLSNEKRLHNRLGCTFMKYPL